jgi:long-subunit acyl-CoA synthetase (AMP-forming)
MISTTLFELLAARKAGVPILHGDTRSWDAPGILQEIEALARHLANTRVLAVLADNGPAWVMADLAAVKAGTVHLPLPAFFSRAQLLHALNATGADAVLTDQPELIANLDFGFIREIDWNGLGLMKRKARPAQLPPGTAKVSFTSGSTSTPKGVCLEMAGLLETAAALATCLAGLPVERHLAVLPLPLLLENVAGVYAPLLRGAEIFLPSLKTLGWQGMAGFEPAALDRTASAVRANSLILVPELAKAWAMHMKAAHLQSPADLVFAAVGGARVEQSQLADWRELGLPAYQGYGLTECGSVVSLNRPGDDGPGVGRPLPHVSVRIENGEVQISTRAFLGYLGAASQADTNEFATGDMGHLDAAGHLHLDGRRKNLLITSYGRNIAPEWVESVLLAETAIAQAVVAGDGRPTLVAILVPSNGFGNGDLATAVERANQALPDYARISGWIEAEPFTLQNGLATGNGRPIRNAILKNHATAIASLYPQEESASAIL